MEVLNFSQFRTTRLTLPRWNSIVEPTWNVEEEKRINRWWKDIADTTAKNTAGIRFIAWEVCPVYWWVGLRHGWVRDVSAWSGRLRLFASEQHVERLNGVSNMHEGSDRTRVLDNRTPYCATGDNFPAGENSLMEFIWIWIHLLYVYPLGTICRRSLVSPVFQTFYRGIPVWYSRDRAPPNSPAKRRTQMFDHESLNKIYRGE